MTDLARTEPSLDPWWLPRPMEVGQCGQYCVGPLAVYLKRLQGLRRLDPAQRQARAERDKRRAVRGENQ